MFFVEIYGGFRLNAQHFTSRNPVNWNDNEIRLRALCIPEATKHWSSQLVDVDVILTEEEYITPSDPEYEMLKTYGQQISDQYDHSVMIGIGVEEPDNSIEVSE